MAFAWNREMGIDVEEVEAKTDMDGIAKRYFSKDEVSAYLSTRSSNKMEVFYNCWTGKEAFIKAKGKGFSIELGSFAVESRTDKPAKLLSVSWDPSEVGKWTFHRFKPQEDFISTLAYESGDVQIIVAK